MLLPIANTDMIAQLHIDSVLDVDLFGVRASTSTMVHEHIFLARFLGMVSQAYSITI